MDTDNKLYELLGVTRTSSDAEIKKVRFQNMWDFLSFKYSVKKLPQGRILC